jgi:hypothetical protein
MDVQECELAAARGMSQLLMRQSHLTLATEVWPRGWQRPGADRRGPRLISRRLVRPSAVCALKLVQGAFSSLVICHILISLISAIVLGCFEQSVSDTIDFP